MPTAVRREDTACQRTAELFAALGDSHRLRIVMLLGDRELCVSEIAAELADNHVAELVRNAFDHTSEMV